MNVGLVVLLLVWGCVSGMWMLVMMCVGCGDSIRMWLLRNSVFLMLCVMNSMVVLMCD